MKPRKLHHGFRMVGAWNSLCFDLKAMRILGVRIGGTLGDIDPLSKVPFERATSRVKKGPL